VFRSSNALPVQIITCDIAEFTVRARHRLSLAVALQAAVEKDQLSLEFQPQVTTNDGTLVGFEALLRWELPGEGRIPPVEFIPLAERTGIINQIDAWVLHEACRQAQQWNRAGHQFGRIAVNVSRLELRAKDYADQVRRTLQRTELPPELLEIEATESALVEHLDSVATNLNELRSLGITVEVDDFGTGYSSLSPLVGLPVDRLKIDGSFISPLPEAEDSGAVVTAIVALARALGLEVLAECVETSDQAVFLQHNPATLPRDTCTRVHCRPEQLPHTSKRGRRSRRFDRPRLSVVLGGLTWVNKPLLGSRRVFCWCHDCSTSAGSLGGVHR